PSPPSTPPPAPVAETPLVPPQTTTPPANPTPTPVVTETPPVAVVTPQPTAPPPPLRLVLSPPATNSLAPPPATTTRVGGEVTANAGVPSDVLIALRGAPVGGVRGPEQPGSTASERLAFQPPQSSPLEGVLRVVTLTQLPHEQPGGNRSDLPFADTAPRTQTPNQVMQPEAPPQQRSAVTLPAVVRLYLQRIEQLWKATVTDLFGKGMPQWQPEEGLLPKAEPPAQPP